MRSLADDYIKGFAIRFVLACIGFSLVLYCFGQYVLEILTPLFKWAIVHFDSNYHVISFGLKQHGHDAIYVLQVSLAQLVVLGGQFVVPQENGVANASTVASHVWQMSVMFLAVLFAWPINSLLQVILRVLFGLPLLLLVLLCDTPLTLLSAIWALVLQELDPHRFSILLAWNDFLEAGGRLVIGLVSGALSLFFILYFESTFQNYSKSHTGKVK